MPCPWSEIPFIAGDASLARFLLGHAASVMIPQCHHDVAVDWLATP
jgi:hypothetical protein